MAGTTALKGLLSFSGAIEELSWELGPRSYSRSQCPSPPPMLPGVPQAKGGMLSWAGDMGGLQGAPKAAWALLMGLPPGQEPSDLQP